MKPRPELVQIVENALDFLDHALAEVEDSPKYSVIHFYAALELFLKARLLEEHWTLVVTKPDTADILKFREGDFQSVTLEETRKRLSNILQEPLPDKYYKTFDDLRKHRNRMVHFFHEAIVERTQQQIRIIVSEQLKAWNYLHVLLTEDWADTFSTWSDKFDEISEKLKRHRDFLRPTFEEQSPAIEEAKKRGVTFVDCPSCGYPAMEENDQVGALYEGICRVCGFQAGFLTIRCDKCERLVTFHDEGFGDCQCGRRFEPSDLATILNEFAFRKDDSRLPAHCTSCEHTNSVILYRNNLICTSCFQIWEWEDIAACNWCGEFNAGDMSESNFHGCVICEGGYGHRMSKDD